MWTNVCTRTIPTPTFTMMVMRIDTLSASERAFQAFPWTRRITVRSSGEWTAAMQPIGYRLTNKIPPPTLFARWLYFLRATGALEWAVFYNQNFEFVSPDLIFFSSTSGIKT